jgi:hypothetical protein
MSSPDTETAWRHYDSVRTQLAGYFRMYMQAWSIVATGVFVGLVFGSGVPPFLQGAIVCVIPLALLLCALLTSWFWAYFASHRSYLKKLEGAFPGDNPTWPSLYADETAQRTERLWERVHTCFTCVVGGLVYLAFVCPAAAHAAKTLYRSRGLPAWLHWSQEGYFWTVWWGYVVLAVLGVAGSGRFVSAASRRHLGESPSANARKRN